MPTLLQTGLTLKHSLPLPLTPLSLCLSNNKQYRRRLRRPLKSHLWLGESMAGPGKQCVPFSGRDTVNVRYLTVISFLVSHRDGHGVSKPCSHPNHCRLRVLLKRTSKGCLCGPFWGQEPFERSLANRACIFLSQHRVILVECLDIDPATLL